jgi:AraC-like DNA-binding protein
VWAGGGTHHNLTYIHIVGLFNGIANLGSSTLHHRFKAVTAMSPLQYQKQLRLQEARRLLLGEGLDVASACYRVGYESPSQFSREYSRQFGCPPSRDTNRVRHPV